MCYSCDYCGKGQWSAQLRMVPDASLSGALQMCCHDCYHDADPCEDDGCAWFDRQTADEWAEERQAQAEMRAEALADKADAARAMRQEAGFNLTKFVMFG